jgi:Flp pilus assembly protein TadD
MNRQVRFGTTLSALAIAAVLSGCAASQSRESIFGSKVDRSNIGLATRAQVALASDQHALAVELAEKAVENTPNDAGFRGLLGNCYFAAGRFASAEAAYRDSLTLIPAQPQLLLKLALVQIAQGKNAQALGLLESARDALEPADYGLAIALAGRAADAVAVLNQAARTSFADARVRQNLALAYGLSGDWMMARTVAEQDVPPEQVDSRIQQWMAMATPSQPSDQVAALTGVKPVAVDPGQPTRLALNRAPQPQSEAIAQAVIPQVQPQPPVAEEIAAAPPPALPKPMPAAAVVEAAPPAPVIEAPAPVVAEAVEALIAPAPQPVAEVPLVQSVAAEPARELPTRFEASVQAADFVGITETVRRAAAKSRRSSGRSNSVVQLGAYSSPERVSVAWNRITKKYPALRDYTPMRAKFNGPTGTVWRLSIKGFASRSEAVERCEKLQGRGGACFVRTVAGDAPVQLASR